MADLLDEPFLALPAERRAAARLLARRSTSATATRRAIAAEINDTEETYEAVASGIGVCLLAAGNAPIFARGDVTMLPVARPQRPPSSCSPGTSATARRCSRPSPRCAVSVATDDGAAAPADVVAGSAPGRGAPV